MRKSYAVNNGQWKSQSVVTNIQSHQLRRYTSQILRLNIIKQNVLEKLQKEQIEYFKERDVKINFINKSMVQAIVGLIHMIGMAYATKEKKN